MFRAMFNGHAAGFQQTDLSARTLSAAKREATAWAKGRGAGTLRLIKASESNPVRLCVRDCHLHGNDPWVTHASTRDLLLMGVTL